MRRNRSTISNVSSDADYAAGGMTAPLMGDDPLSGSNSNVPLSRANSVISTTSDIEFYEDVISDPVLVLGVDISHLSRNMQFIVCGSGVFFFSLLYGYLQELLSVKLCSRKLGLYLAMVQFTGYTFLAYILRTYVYQKQQNRSRAASADLSSKPGGRATLTVPFKLYLGLSMLRAVDLAMTNLAMQYINYPAKTLMKSSRVVFTMIFGVCITRKRYSLTDYAIVLCMVFGLVIFMHADATSSAVFEPAGVIMLTISLMCDGAITNMSESIMQKYKVGQDEFIFRMYSIALLAIIAAAMAKGDLTEGMVWILEPGTYEEQQNNVPLEQRSWSSAAKITVMILFSSMGFFGSSCAAAITKNFGALSMSITSVSRKATTVFLSFLLFDNDCTFQHIIGIIIFISSLTAKSIRRKNKRRKSFVMGSDQNHRLDLELGGEVAKAPRSRNLSRSNSGYNSDANTVETTSTTGDVNRNRRRNVRSSTRSMENRGRYHIV